jgi:hypothetical protein
MSEPKFQSGPPPALVLVSRFAAKGQQNLGKLWAAQVQDADQQVTSGCPWGVINNHGPSLANLERDGSQEPVCPFEINSSPPRARNPGAFPAFHVA